MSNKRSAKTQKRQRRLRQEKARQTSRGYVEDSDEVDLIGSIDRALDDPSPLPLLESASALVAALDPRRRDPFEPETQPSITVDEFARSLMDVDMRQTTGALAAIAPMVDDDLLRARIRREVANRRHLLPEWLNAPLGVHVHRAVEMTHVLGDGDDVILGVRVAGHEFTAIVYVDHNLGTIVKDGFVVDQPITDVLALMKDVLTDPDTAFGDFPLADARARLAEAIAAGAMAFPPYESETWPGIRPLVEWLLRDMPPGGACYARPALDDAELDELLDEFFASEFGKPLDSPRQRDLVDGFVFFATEFGLGDPLRWSNVSLEILLLDWIPGTMLADLATLELAPDTLRAFVRYSHRRRGIRPELTSETLEAVDLAEAEYRRLIRSGRGQGGRDFLSLLAGEHSDFETYEEWMLGVLADEVGGEQALSELDAEPLSDEPFDWAGIPADIREPVEQIRALVDDCCDEFLDVEYRTACRRFLARAARGKPDVFRRKASVHTRAAAVSWVICKANGLFDLFGRGLLVRDLLAHFGIQSGSVSQPAGVLLRAAGIESEQYGGMSLGSPDFLVSGWRQRIIEARHRYSAEVC